MQALMIIISILLILDSIALIGLVLMQQGKVAGLSGAISGAAESYFGKNRARTMEGRMEKWTKILGALFLVIAFALYIIVSKL